MVVAARGMDIRELLPKPVAATLIVAAYNSLHPERADFHCIGVNDNLALQAAVNALSPGGGTIYLLDGDYYFSSTYVDVPSRISITGGPGAKIHLPALGVFTRTVGAQLYSLDADAANWTVEAGAAVLANEGAIVKEGAGSLKVDPSAVPCEVQRAFAASDWRNYGVLVLWYYKDSTAGTRLDVRIKSGVNYSEWRFWVGATRLGWQELYCRFDSPDTISGTLNLSAVNAISIVMDNAAPNFYFDSIRLMHSDIIVENISLMGVEDGSTESAFSVYFTAFSTFRNLQCNNIGDEIIEARGCRAVNFIDNFCSQRYYFPAGPNGGGPCVDFGGTGGAKRHLNRFCKIARNHVFRFTSGAIRLDGDANEISLNTCAYGGQDLGDPRHGIVLGEAYTFDNDVIDNYIEGVERPIAMQNGAHDNRIERNRIVNLDSGSRGIYLELGNRNIIKNNHCLSYNGGKAIWVRDNVDDTIIEGNILDGFTTGIDLDACDDTVVRHNHFLNNTTAVDIAAGAARTKLLDNQYDGNTTDVIDASTSTIYNSVIFPFIRGTDLRQAGYLIDADTEYATAWFYIPDWVKQVICVRVYGEAQVAEADKMRLELVQCMAGADNEPSATHATGAVANLQSVTSNFANGDIIHWRITHAAISAMSGGDSGLIEVRHEAAGDGDIDTQCRFKTVEFQYI